MLNRHFQMQLFCLRFKDEIMAKVVAQDNTVTFELIHTSFSGLGGDSVTDWRTDGQMDGGYCNIPSAFLKKRRDNKMLQTKTYTECS